MDLEQTQEFFKRTILSDEARYARLLSDITALADRVSPDLEVEAALYKAVVDTYDTEPKLTEAMHDFVVVRTDLSTTQHRYMLRSGLQKIARRESFSKNASYPDLHHNVCEWRKTITTILGSTALSEELQYDLHNRRPQTNIPDRYKSIPTFVSWARANGRLPEKLTLMDFGCARNLGIKSLASVEINSDPAFAIKKYYKYGDTQVVDPVDQPDITRAQRVSSNEQLTAGFNIAQNSPIGLETGLGFDIDDFSEPGTREWSLANLTPNEFATGVASTIELFEVAFMNKNRTVRPKISFAAADVLLSPEAQEFNRLEEGNETKPSGYADISIIFTTLNQMSDQQQRTALKSIRRYTKPDGFIVIQDFARVHEESPLELEFLDSDWNKHYSYRTIVLDMADRSRYIELFRFSSGRAQVVNIPKDEVGRAPQMTPAESFKAIDIATHLGNLATVV